MDQDKFQGSKSIVYSQLFDESENRPFEVPPRRTKTYDLKNRYLMLQSYMFYSKIILFICSWLILIPPGVCWDIMGYESDILSSYI